MTEALSMRELIEHGNEVAERLFERDGYLHPMWLGVCEDGTHFVMPAPPVSDKDLAAIMVRVIFKQKRVIRCLFIDECWMIRFPDGWGEDKVKANMRKWFKTHDTLEEHPMRQEMVLFQGEDYQKGAVGAKRSIIRDTSGKPRLGPLDWEDEERLRGMEGRFVGMLPNLGGHTH